MIGVLSAILNPDKQTNPDLVVGSQIGAEQYLAAMYQHLSEETLGIFVPEAGITAAAQDVRRLQQNLEDKPTATVKIFGFGQLPNLLQSNTDFLTLHDSTGPFMHRPAYIRANFASRCFPITCLCHGLSQASALWDFYTRLLLTPTLPCDAVICTSHAARNAFTNLLNRVKETWSDAVAGLKLCAPRLEVVPLGVDTEVFRPRNRSDARKLLGLPANAILLLYFGRIETRTKGDLGPLIQVCRELIRRHGIDVRLVLAGNYVEQQVSHLRELAVRFGLTDNLLFRPRPTLVEGPLYYAAADIFVSIVDTLQESYGITPIEAMACGIPVVVSDWSGYRDTVIHGETGYRVSTYWTDCAKETSRFAPIYHGEYNHLQLGQSVAVDTMEMLTYLSRLIESRELRQTMGQRAREHVLANLDWRTVMQQVCALWKELHSIAATLPHTKSVVRSCPEPDYFADFAHFATKCLSDSDMPSITELGRDACRHPDLLNVYPEMQATLRRPVLSTTLRYLRAMRWFRQEVRLYDLQKMIAQKYALSPSGAAAHIMWLLKYGHLTINYDYGDPGSQTKGSIVKSIQSL